MRRFIFSIVLVGILAAGVSWGSSFFRVYRAVRRVEGLMDDARLALLFVHTKARTVPLGALQTSDRTGHGKAYQRLALEMKLEVDRALEHLREANSTLAQLSVQERKAALSGLNGLFPSEFIPAVEIVSRGFGKVEDLGRSLAP